MRDTETGLSCQYYKELDQLDYAEHHLATLRFDAQAQNTLPNSIAVSAAETLPVLSTGLRPLGTDAAGEQMSVFGKRVKSGYGSCFYWAETDQYLFVALWADEQDTPDLVETTKKLYLELLQQIRDRGYPHLVRVWNYFADINAETAGMERYRQFCLGRFDAFDQCGINENQYPSACALGHGGGDLLIYALASKIAPQHFENPRQTSAYHYPREYGPRSPSFARASLVRESTQTAKLFVSGTASVVGFVTQHPYDLTEQLKVTLGNLALLLAHVVEQQTIIIGKAPRVEGEVLKVYVRRPADLDEIKMNIERSYPGMPTVYLVADICRADLLLEIDGIWNLLS